MRRVSNLLWITMASVLWIAAIQAQTPPAARGAQAQPQAGRGGTPVPGGRGGPAPVPKKHLLVIGMTRGYHHGSTSNGLATFWMLGNQSGVWDTEIKTDMEWITKKPPSSEAHSLDWFDAVAFVNTTGDWKLDDEQRQALLSFVHDDGKGLVLAHAAIDANYDWPEFAEMTGGWFQAHPWGTFDAPVIVEDPTFPAMRHFPARLFLYDEMYSPKNWSREKVNVLMRLDETQLNYTTRNTASRPRAPTKTRPSPGRRCTVRAASSIPASATPRRPGRTPTFRRCISKPSSGR